MCCSSQPSHWPRSRVQGRKITIALHHPDTPMVFQWLEWAGQRSGSVYLTPGCWRVCLTLGQMDPLSFLLWQPQSKYRGAKVEVSSLRSTSSSGRWVDSSLELYCKVESLETTVHTLADPRLAHRYMWSTSSTSTRTTWDWKKTISSSPTGYSGNESICFLIIEIIWEVKGDVISSAQPIWAVMRWAQIMHVPCKQKTCGCGHWGLETIPHGDLTLTCLSETVAEANSSSYPLWLWAHCGHYHKTKDTDVDKHS